MQESPHILLLSPQPFFQARGTPINVREMLYALSELEVKVTLLCYPFGEDIPIKNVNIVRSPKPFFIKEVKIGPSHTKILLDLFFMFKAFQLCFRKKYCIVHGIEEAGLIAGLIGISMRKPFIVDVDSAMSQQLEESGFIKSRLVLSTFEKIEGFFFKRATRVITVCEALSKEVLKLAPEAKITQIEDFPLEYSPTNSKTINLREKYKIPSSRRIALYGGNFEPYQGIDLLISALNLVKDSQSSDIHLVLVGGSKAHIAHYQDLVRSYALTERVSFTGQVDSSLMEDIHNQADVLVSPRLTGTNTPLKIYSYLQSGKAIVATDIYSHTQILNQDCAFLAKPEPQDFSKALLRASGKNEMELKEIKRRSENAKHLAETKYSRKHFRQKLSEVYREIFSLHPNKKTSMASRLDIPTDVASSSNDYALRFSGPVGEYFLNSQTLALKKALKNYLESKPKGLELKVLELGGGHCQLTQTYLDLGFKVTIQGSEERSFSRAKELGFGNNPSVDFVICPLSKLNFESNEFNLVSAFRIFAHVKDWKELSSEMFRISKDGIVFDFSNYLTLNALSPVLYKAKKLIEKDSRPFACQSSLAIKQHLNRLGSKEVKMVPQFVIPMGLHRALKKRAMSQGLEKSLSMAGLSFLGNPVVTFAKK